MARERTCIVTRLVKPEQALIRLAIAPDGTVTPDLAAKLPGRGAWISADRASVETAVRKNTIARAAGRSVAAAPDLADTIEALLAARCLALIGLARRAGHLVLGADQVRAALKSGGAACVIEAADGAADGRGKILKLAAAAAPNALIVGCFTAEALGEASGRASVHHLLLPPGPSADRFASEINRLAGFRLLTPADWSAQDS